MASTPLRSIRISDELWRVASEHAAENLETVSDVIRRALEQYISEDR